MTDEKARRRWINFGELVALAALIVSAVGVWIAWKSSNQNKPTEVIEHRSAVPLALRGRFLERVSCLFKNDEVSLQRGSLRSARRFRSN